MTKYNGHALITGGSSGIGLEFAYQLAAQGYNLVLVARNMEKLEKAASNIKHKYPVDVLVISQDMAKLESADIIYKQLQAQNIQVGLLINNAGFNVSREIFHKLDLNRQIEMVNLLCIGYMSLIHKFLPAMLEKKSSGIIIVSSFSALLPAPLASIYSAAKAFTLKFGINLHAEYSNKGIDILTVCPAFVETNFFEAAGNPVPPLALLTTNEVVKKSLQALGNEIVLVLNNKQFKLKLMFLLSKILSDKIIEKLVRKYIKDSFKITL